MFCEFVAIILLKIRFDDSDESALSTTVLDTPFVGVHEHHVVTL